jgi:hypothetical protein
MVYHHPRFVRFYCIFSKPLRLNDVHHLCLNESRFYLRKKLKAREMLEKSTESQTSSARFVRLPTWIRERVASFSTFSNFLSEI